MAPRYLNPASEDGVVKVLQLSDLHLFADAKKDLLGVNTFDSFCATVDTIASENREYDFIAVTGDISQDYSVASYERFGQEIVVVFALIVISVEQIFQIVEGNGMNHKFAVLRIRGGNATQQKCSKKY